MQVAVVMRSLRVVMDHWQRMLLVLVLARLHLVAHQLRQERRLVGMLCEVELARRMQQRQQVWQRVLLLWHRVDLWRMHRLRQRMQPRQVVRQPTRQLRSQVRRQVVLCCLVVVATRRQRRRLATVLVELEDRLELRVKLLVRLWLVVVDRLRRRGMLRPGQRKLEVAAIAMCSRQRAKLLVRLCHREEDRHRMLLMRQHWQRRVLVLQWTRLLR